MSHMSPWHLILRYKIIMTTSARVGYRSETGPLRITHLLMRLMRKWRIVRTPSSTVDAVTTTARSVMHARVTNLAVGRL